MIRLPVPPLSEERRIELVKSAKTRGEDAKVAIRNVRRHIKDQLHKTVNDENISEDMGYEADEELQSLTDQYTEKIDAMLAHKEEEIMEV
jgi:ribosome recycling factor